LFKILLVVCLLRRDYQKSGWVAEHSAAGSSVFLDAMLVSEAADDFVINAVMVDDQALLFRW
jgi:hypothetical protein